MHGRNLFPSRIPFFRETVLDSHCSYFGSSTIRERHERPRTSRAGVSESTRTTAS